MQSSKLYSQISQSHKWNKSSKLNSKIKQIQIYTEICNHYQRQLLGRQAEKMYIWPLLVTDNLHFD